MSVLHVRLIDVRSSPQAVRGAVSLQERPLSLSSTPVPPSMNTRMTLGGAPLSLLDGP
jgi:hypothetical protein